MLASSNLLRRREVTRAQGVPVVGSNWEPVRLGLVNCWRSCCLCYLALWHQRPPWVRGMPCRS
jgi:hypothetical protein